MADNFTRQFQYGLNNLPVEPPDDPNTLFSPNGFTSIGMQRVGQAQVVPAQFRVPLRRPLPHPAQPGLAPGGGQLPEIPVPAWWKFVGPMLQVLPRIGNGPGVGGGREEIDCDKEWREARASCVEELAKPFPNKTMTGGYTNVEDCARGIVAQACLGNPVDWGPQEDPGKNKRKRKP